MTTITAFYKIHGHDFHRDAEANRIANRYRAKLEGSGTFLPTLMRDIQWTIPEKRMKQFLTALKHAKFRVQVDSGE